MKLQTRLILLTGIVVQLLSTSSAGAVAAQPAQKKPDPPVFGAGVTLVAVPVFVTDKSFKSVPGLTAQDFEVEDGGKRVSIVAFHAVDVEGPSAGLGEGARADLPAPMRAEAPRQFLLLLDLNFSPAEGIRRSRTAGIAFVRDALAPGDLIAVATADAGGIKLLTNFTTDHAHAARAISRMGLVGTLGADPLGLSGGIQASGGAGYRDEEFADQDGLLSDALKRGYQHHAKAFIENLSQLVQLLSPLHGRKQVVLLSGGFSESAWNSAPERTSVSGDGTALLGRMEELFRKAGQSDVVIHTISLNGIEGPLDVGSRTGRSDIRGSNGDTVARFNDNSGRGTLTTLAHNTGGRFILPTNDFSQALREVEQISRHSYVIAFEAASPSSEGEKPRSLKVRVRREGLSVSHRPSYSVATPAWAGDADSVRMQAAEAISKGLTEGPLRLSLVTMPYRDLAGKASVQAVLEIGGPALSEAAKAGQLAIQVYGYSMRAGAVLDSMALNTSIDLAKFGTAVRNTGIRVVTAFPASEGDADLRFFARAGTSGMTGSIQRNAVVPAFAEGEPVLSAPIFTTPHAGKVFVPFQPQSRPWITIPFRLGSDPFVPEATVTLKSGRAREVCVFVWPARTDAGPPFDVTADLARKGETPRALRIQGAPRVVPDVDGFDRYVVTVVPPEATPGPYSLRLTFRDPATAAIRYTDATVVIEK